MEPAGQILACHVRGYAAAAHLPAGYLPLQAATGSLLLATLLRLSCLAGATGHMTSVHLRTQVRHSFLNVPTGFPTCLQPAVVLAFQP